MQDLKQSLEHQRKEINDCRAEITSLKMHIEGSHLGKNLVVSDVNTVQSQSSEKYEEEIKKLQMEIELLKENNIRAPEPGNFVGSESENFQTDDKVIEIHEDRAAISNPVDVALGVEDNQDSQSPVVQTLNEHSDNHEHTLPELFSPANTHSSNPANTNSSFENIKNDSELNVGEKAEDTELVKSDSVSDDLISEKIASFLHSWLCEILKKHHFLLVSYGLPFLNW